MYERKRGPLSRTRLQTVAVVAICVLAVGIPVAPVAADETPPPPPAAYYGEVTVGGEPAPAGTVIEARIDGEIRGSIVVDESGVFGSPNGTSAKLTVDGTPDEVGSNVTFLVNGVPAETRSIVEWESADHRRVNITAPGNGGGIPPAPPGSGESNITITDAELSADQIDVGGEAQVTATVENLGDGDGATTLDLAVDGLTVDSETVSLEAGEEMTLTFTRAFDEAGRYDVSIGDTEAGTLRVGSANVVVSEAGLNATTVEPGDAVAVTATVENDGAVAVERSVELVVDGTVVDTKPVELEAGGETTLTFTHAFANEGEYEVAVNDESAGSVTVSADDAGDDGDGISGFGVVATIAALLTLGTVARRRLGD